MNYIGSKLSLLEFLSDSINKVVTKDAKIFCDLFSGTSAVGSLFKKAGYKIIANDIQYYSYVLNRHYIGNHKELLFKNLENIIKFKTNNTSIRKLEVCDYLTKIPPKKGFIYNNYASGGTKSKEFERIYFSDENAQKCDAIREKIETWHKECLINQNEYFFLLTSLLEAIDKVANTASVYGAFLKTIKKSAQKSLNLKPAELIINDNEHNIYNKDANDLIKEIETDILYLDPPYNERQYCANYHLLETIAKNDAPTIKGKTGLRDYKSQKSKYCSKNTVLESFSELINNANAKYIFLSYNNEGLLKIEDIKRIFEKKGIYGYFTKEYNRFKADANREYKANKTTEFLHFCICKN